MTAGKVVVIGQEAARQKARAKLAASGIDDAGAKKLGLEVLTSEEVGTLHPSFHRVPAIKIPYYAVGGKRTGFYRVRYLDKPPGFAGVVAKPQRYAQEPKTLNEVYFPRNLNWEEILKDPKVPMWITEGEFKAGCAALREVACAAIGGVFVWRSAKNGIAFLPQLEKIEWKGRQVIIVFDSDLADNPNVSAAQRMLGREVLARGAKPILATVPSGPNGAKWGLDDFIVHKGVDALDEILAEAPDFDEADALWALNEEVILIRDPGVILERETGRVLDPFKFMNVLYSDRHYVRITGGTKTKPPRVEKLPLAPAWMKWEHRSKLRRMVYEPGKPKIFDDQYNRWSGWPYEPKEGDVTPWVDLLDLVFRGYPATRKWFEQWAAYPIQYPGTKLYSSVLLWGATHGTGKTLVAYILMRLYGSNAVEIGSEDLLGDFNTWALDKQFVYGDEVTGGDSRAQHDKLKRMITRSSVTINEKNVPKFTVRDTINYLDTSNHPDAFFLEFGDRRVMVHEVRGPVQSEAFYERIDRWYKSDDGIRALFHHLLSVDLTGFNPKGHALMTEAKEQMTIAGMSDLGYWVRTLKENPVDVLGKSYDHAVAAGLDLWPARLLLRAYDPSSQTKVTEVGMGRALASQNLWHVNAGKTVRTSYGVVRLIAIRNSEKWQAASAAQIANHFNAFFDKMVPTVKGS